MTTTDKAITVSGLTKKFGGGFRGQDVLALSEVNLEVENGEIFGLLGPNGAGKTTMIKILLGALNASGGNAQIYGIDITKSKARLNIGFLPENHRFPNYLTGGQMLRVYGGMSGLSKLEIKTRSAEYLEMVGMTKWVNTRIKKYSKGMMQRLGLAQAMMNKPNLLFLDEPTDGVDPIGRREIRDVLLRLKEQGKTIFLNSHLLSEVEAVCGRVAILDKGRLIKVGPIDQLVNKQPNYDIEVKDMPFEMAERVKTAYPNSTLKGNVLSVIFENDSQVNGLIDMLRQQQIEIKSVIPVKTSLEESFMQLIKGEGVKRDG